MSVPYPSAPGGAKTLSLRKCCERILKELRDLYAESPRKSLEQSIQDATALLARIPKDDAPKR